MSFIFLLVFVLVSVAFFTLFERKILGYSHLRFGPNRVGFGGVFQPFADAVKLFSKFDFSASEFSFFMYFMFSIMGLLVVLVLWGIYWVWGVMFFSNYSFVLFILVSGLNVYFLLFSGWYSSASYSLLGSYRSSAQVISYEVVLVLVIFFICIVWGSLGLYFFGTCGLGFSMMSAVFGIFVCWLFCCLAECNRSPFDFSEGESELVSGFNTEYGGGMFSLIFIGEYASIIFMSSLTGLLFFNFFLVFWSFLIMFFYLWSRSSYPRMRYDDLMMVGWSGLMLYVLAVILLFLAFF